MVDYKSRQELNALSKDLFGVSSRWQKLVNEGYTELLTREVSELVPSEVEGEEPKTEKVRKAVLREDGAPQSVHKRHTVDSVRELMLKLKADRDARLEHIKKLEAKAALVKQINQDVTGSAGL